MEIGVPASSRADDAIWRGKVGLCGSIIEGHTMVQKKGHLPVTKWL